VEKMQLIFKIMQYKYNKQINGMNKQANKQIMKNSNDMFHFIKISMKIWLHIFFSEIRFYLTQIIMYYFQQILHSGYFFKKKIISAFEAIVL
jgi:hypothetical protein